MRVYYYNKIGSEECINTYESEDEVNGNYLYRHSDHYYSSWTDGHIISFTQTHLAQSESWKRIRECQARRYFKAWGVPDDLFDKACVRR